MQKILINLSALLLFLNLNARYQDLDQAIIKSYPEKAEQLLIITNPEQEFKEYLTNNQNDWLKDCLDLANEVLNLKKQALNTPKEMRPDIPYKIISTLLLWSGLITAIQHYSYNPQPSDQPQPYACYKFIVAEKIIALSSFIIWKLGNRELSTYDNRSRLQEYKDALQISQMLTDYLKNSEEITNIGIL